MSSDGRFATWVGRVDVRIGPGAMAETPQPGIADLPEEDVQLMRDTLAAMLAGEFDRFDVFAGPINDNEGNVVLADGEKLEQADLDQFPNEDGTNCETCMYWWAEGITAALP